MDKGLYTIPKNDIFSLSQLYPSGYEIGYDDIPTGNVSISSTSSATPTTIIACSPYFFDGHDVMLDFFAPSCNCNGGNAIELGLYENGVLLYTIGKGYNFYEMTLRCRPILTPQEGMHSFLLGAWKNAGAGPGINSFNGSKTYARWVKL